MMVLVTEEIYIVNSRRVIAENVQEKRDVSTITEVLYAKYLDRAERHEAAMGAAKQRKR